MSTRCQILVEGATAIVYRHSDGYPEDGCGVLASLCPLVAAFTKSRGCWDPVYLTAHIVARMIAESLADAEVQKQRRLAERASASEMASYDNYKWLGYGVEGYSCDPASGLNTLHGDIAYLYVVKKAGYIEILDPGVSVETSTLTRCVLFNGKPKAKPRAKKAVCPAK